MPDDTITSGAELSATVDTSSATTEAPTGAESASADTDVSLDELNAEAPDSEEEIGELEAPDGDEPDPTVEEAEPEPEPEPEPAPAEEELPPGVQMKQTAEGKKKYYLPEAVYKTFQEADQLRQNLAGILGEDVTPEAVALRNTALLQNQRLWTDLSSDDPKVHSQVISEILTNAREAMANGDVTTDPMLPFTEAFLNTIQQSHPDADARILRQSARRTFDDVYELAADLANGRTAEELEASAKAGDLSASRALNLLRSVQHLDKELFKSFKKAGEITARSADPLAEREARIRQREQEIQTRDAAAANERWKSWQTNTRASVRSAVDKAIDAALADVTKAYAKFPNLIDDVKRQLHAKVQEGVGADAAWKELIALDTRKAQRAASEQVRQQHADSIVKRHENKARQILAAHKPAILREAVTRLKAQSDATHQRREAAAQHRAPGSGGQPVKRGIAPVPGQDFEVGTPANLRRFLDSL